jgi:signal recognition particle subunit SEC65
MEPGNEKYNKVLDLLRKSKPDLDSTDDIKREVIKRIERVNHSRLSLSDLVDFLFGWVYIQWVRRSLITASIALVLVFIYQQSVILKRIDYLSRQTIVTERENGSAPADEVEKMFMVYRNSGRRFPTKNITISEKQMKELIESVNELQLKYKDLENLIQEDPELKKMIEKKLIENNRTKNNL